MRASVGWERNLKVSGILAAWLEIAGLLSSADLLTSSSSRPRYGGAKTLSITLPKTSDSTLSAPS